LYLNSNESRLNKRGSNTRVTDVYSLHRLYRKCH